MGGGIRNGAIAAVRLPKILVLGPAHSSCHVYATCHQHCAIAANRLADPGTGYSDYTPYATSERGVDLLGPVPRFSPPHACRSVALGTGYEHHGTFADCTPQGMRDPRFSQRQAVLCMAAGSNASVTSASNGHSRASHALVAAWDAKYRGSVNQLHGSSNKMHVLLKIRVLSVFYVFIKTRDSPVY